VLALEHTFECASALMCALDLVFPPVGWGGVPTFLTLARALTQDCVVALDHACVLRPIVAVPPNQHFDLAAVLADSGIMEIINSIKSPDLYKLACASWLHSPQTKHEYSWLFHIIAPITCFPLELLQQILLIVIDEVSNPPSVLMHVCKHWHVMVTSIWASLKLGLKTTKDDVIQKLERNQLFMDVFVDTKMDCGDFSPSYKAIFTVVEAAARWRSFVVETFPSQTVTIYADFPLFFLRISTKFWRREESSSLRRGQAHISQPQGDMEEGSRPGRSIPATNRKNPYQVTRS